MEIIFIKDQGLTIEKRSGATCSAGCKLPHTLVEFTTQLTELHKLDKMDRLVVETKSEGIINNPNWINKDCS